MTGVQTCALPICRIESSVSLRSAPPQLRASARLVPSCAGPDSTSGSGSALGSVASARKRISGHRRPPHRTLHLPSSRLARRHGRSPENPRGGHSPSGSQEAPVARPPGAPASVLPTVGGGRRPSPAHRQATTADLSSSRSRRGLRRRAGDHGARLGLVPDANDLNLQA